MTSARAPSNSARAIRSLCPFAFALAKLPSAAQTQAWIGQLGWGGVSAARRPFLQALLSIASPQTQRTSS